MTNETPSHHVPATAGRLTLSEWVHIYELSGEMPPAGLLKKQAAEMDAEITTLTDALTEAQAEIVRLQGLLHEAHAPDCDDCEPQSILKDAPKE